MQSAGDRRCRSACGPPARSSARRCGWTAWTTRRRRRFTRDAVECIDLEADPRGSSLRAGLADLRRGRVPLYRAGGQDRGGGAGGRDLHRAAQQGGAARRRAQISRPYRASGDADGHAGSLDDAGVAEAPRDPRDHPYRPDRRHRADRAGSGGAGDRPRARTPWSRRASRRPGSASARINPHAGENGLFGRGEEADKIMPAVEACQAKGWNVDGPLPADTLFFLRRRAATTTSSWRCTTTRATARSRCWGWNPA